MEKRHLLFDLVGIVMVAVIVLSACSAARGPVLTPTSTAQQTAVNPSASNTEAAAPTITDTPSPTAAPTDTDTPAAVTAAIPSVAVTTTPAPQVGALVVPNLNAYCRKGPGISYDAITFLTKGQSYNVTGRDSLRSWWQVLAPGNVHCWVGNANVASPGSDQQIAIVLAPPLPNIPGQFVSSFVCNASLKTFSVALNWATPNYITGYRIYRNGTEIVELGANVTSYSDEAPLGSGLLYELEAFNDYGVAPRISNSVPACQ